MKKVCFIFITILSMVLISTSCTKEVKKEVEQKNITAYKKTPEPIKDVADKVEVEEDIPEKEEFLLLIDPGHGDNSFDVMEQIAPGSQETKPGFAFGTQGVATGKTERDLNMELSNLLKERLEDSGIKIVMTREGRACDLTNIARAEFGNEIGADLVVKVHANGAESSSAKGAMVLIPSSKHITDANMISESRIAGKYILDSFIEKTSANSLGVIERDDMTGFNWSKVPVIFVEMGFMTNPEEDILMSTPEYQEKMADGIKEGILKYKQHLGK